MILQVNGDQNKNFLIGIQTMNIVQNRDFERRITNFFSVDDFSNNDNSAIGNILEECMRVMIEFSCR